MTARRESGMSVAEEVIESGALAHRVNELIKSVCQRYRTGDICDTWHIYMCAACYGSLGSRVACFTQRLYFEQQFYHIQSEIDSVPD